MAHRRHEIPTHLNVEDKAFYGLSARQVMYLMIGISGSYGLWNQWSHVPIGLRLALALSCVAVSTAVALLRLHGRALEEWLFVILRYAARPKAAVWRPSEPDSDPSWPSAVSWEELAPRVTWEEEL